MSKQEKMDRAFAKLQAAEAAHKAAPSAKTLAALTKAGDAFERAEAAAMFGDD